MEQDKQQLRPSHIISINYLDLHQAFATHEFQVQSNLYIKSMLSKTQENSRLKTRYSKGITTEQLFIIYIIRDYIESSLFYSTSKNELKQTRHTFILFSILLDHTLLL